MYRPTQPKLTTFVKHYDDKILVDDSNRNGNNTNQSVDTTHNDDYKINEHGRITSSETAIVSDSNDDSSSTIDNTTTLNDTTLLPTPPQSKPNTALLLHALKDLSDGIAEHRANATAFAHEMQSLVTDMLLVRGSRGSSRSGMGCGTAVAAAHLVDGWYGLNERAVANIELVMDRVRGCVGSMRC